ASARGTRTIIIDLRRVTEIDATGARILADIQSALSRKNQRFALALAKNSEVAGRISDAGIIELIGADRVFEDIDRAMEWAEDHLIRADAKRAKTDTIALARVDLLSSLTPAELEIVERHTRRETFSRGEIIFREGEPGKELFIVIEGRASAYLNQVNGGTI